MFWSCRQSAYDSVAEILSFNAKCVVETGAIVFPGDRGDQFDELGIVEFLAQAGEESVGNFDGSLGHGVGEFEDQALEV
jgi:hypothetical protein